MVDSCRYLKSAEAGDSSMPVDLIVCALVASGATTRDIQTAF